MKNTKQNKRLMKLIDHIKKELENNNQISASDAYIQKLAKDFARTQKPKDEWIKLADARKKLLEENELMLKLIWIVGGGVMFQSHIIKFCQGILSKNTIISNLKKLTKYEATEISTSGGNNIIILKYSAIKHITKNSNPETVNYDRNMYRKCGFLGAMFLKRYEGYELEADKLAEFEKLSIEEQKRIVVQHYINNAIKTAIEEKKKIIFNGFIEKDVSEIVEILKEIMPDTEDAINTFKRMPLEEQVNMIYGYNIKYRFSKLENQDKAFKKFIKSSDKEKLEILIDFSPILQQVDKLKQFIVDIQKETTMTKIKDAKFIQNCIVLFTQAKEQYDQTVDKLSARNKVELTLTDFDSIINRFQQEVKFQELKNKIATEELVNIRKPKGQIKKLDGQGVLQDDMQEAEKQEKIAKLQEKITEGTKRVEVWQNEILALQIYQGAYEGNDAEKEQANDSLMTIRNHSVFVESLKVNQKAVIDLHLAIPDFSNSLFTKNITTKIFNTYNFFLLFFNLNQFSAFQLNIYYNIYVADDDRRNVILKQMKDIKPYLKRRNLNSQVVDSIQVTDLKLTKTVFNNQKF